MIILILILLAFLNSIVLPQSEIKKIDEKDTVVIKNNNLNDTIVFATRKKISINKKSLLDSNYNYYLITKNEIEDIDYRVFTDVFNNRNFVFNKNLSSFGTPNYISYYGQISNKVSILLDGIELNNRFNSFYDINNLLSENVELIELIPISHSFLFNNTGIAVINFNSFEPTSKKPFSRIKFFQASDEEGFIDGMINLMPFKNITTFINFSNQSYDGRFANSSFSNWKGLIRLKYNYSEKVNFAISYFHNNNSIRLNGGVDIDSIKKISNGDNYNEIAFDNVLSPVRFNNRYLTSITDRILLNSLAKLSENNSTEVSFYYQKDENYFRQNSVGALQSNVFPIKRENFSLTKGFYIKSNFIYDDYSFFINTNFERNQFNSQILDKQNVLSFFNISSGASFTFNEFVKSNIYGKFLTQAQSTYFGLGGDITFEIFNLFKIYFGFSGYKNPFNYLERVFVLNKNWNQDSNIKTIESKIIFENKNINVNLSYFSTQNDNFLIPAFIFYDYKNDNAYFVKSINSKNSALNLFVSATYWKMFIHNSYTYYFNNVERINRGLPEYENKTSIFYNDILFNNNLKLKVGFNLFTIGKRYEQRFDFEKGLSSSYYFMLSDNSLKQISDKIFSTSFKLDFFLIGTIQENAKIYITWENLFDSKFYFIPYYPAYPRNLKLGVAWNFLD
ncbi:MAG: TonB-dependent receptor plug domain-containing protein [Melioribacteraceae bacterium]|nr:TonB-dependent receptor plug domain-containing protein [Melioribacteraceae bacterium]